MTRPASIVIPTVSRCAYRRDDAGRPVVLTKREAVTVCRSVLLIQQVLRMRVAEGCSVSRKQLQDPVDRLLRRSSPGENGLAAGPAHLLAALRMPQ